MRAGNYKYRIKVFQPTTTVNDYGESIESYELERTTRCAVDFRSNSRQVQNSEILFPTQYTITVHSYINITDKTQIEFEDRRYRIVEYHEDKTFRDKVITIELIND